MHCVSYAMQEDQEVEMSPEERHLEGEFKANAGKLSCYPFWPSHRSRPRYSHLEDAKGRSVDSSNDTKCEKDPTDSNAPKWTSGIFTVVCPHNFIYGFHVMTRPESPSDVFTILRTLIPEDKLPEVIYYDNGCKLLQYILGRDPSLVRNMQVFVDRFHFGDINDPIHKCSPGFNPSNSFDTFGMYFIIPGLQYVMLFLCLYPMRCMGCFSICVFLLLFIVFSGTNTSAAEQVNSFINLFCRQSNFYSLDNFMMFTKAVFSWWNFKRYSEFLGCAVEGGED